MHKLLTKLLEAGIRAPSGDNCQPWRFRIIADGAIKVYLLPKEAESFFDHGYRASYLSVGAVCENMRTAAVRHGYAIAVDYTPLDGSSGNPAAIMAVTPASGPDSFAVDAELYTAMHLRTVNRRPYLPMGIGKAVWDEFLAIAPVPGVHVSCYPTGEKRRAARRLVRLADEIRWTHPQIHRELFAKIRYGADEIERTRTGLEVDRLGAGPLAGPVMRFLSSWDHMTALKPFGLATMLARQGSMLVDASSGVVCVWTEDDTPEAWMRGGEVVQRLWNRASKMGLQIQPMPVALYLWRRCKVEGKKAFLAQHTTLLSEIGTLVQALTPREGLTGIMLFRIGKGLPMQGVATRMDLSKFLPDDQKNPGSSTPDEHHI